MMLKRSLVFSFGLLFLGFNAFCDVWYSENFDDFKDGDIAGWDHPTALTAYIDDIEMGDGEGETAGKPQAVSASDKLATTWGRIKQRL